MVTDALDIVLKFGVKTRQTKRKSKDWLVLIGYN